MATREEQREYQRNWVARRRRAYLAGKVCARCGATDDLHVHHRDPKQKVHHAIWSWREERRLDELAKCEVLCRPCHQAHHALIREQHGTTSRYKHGCRCDLCRSAAAAAKQERRVRSRRPCSHGCGTLVDTIDRRDPGKPLECRKCAQRRVAAARRAA